MSSTRLYPRLRRTTLPTRSELAILRLFQPVEQPDRMSQLLRFVRRLPSVWEETLLQSRVK